jgi:hypothetical protein
MASIIIISQESRECSEQMNFVKHFNNRIAWVTHASTTVMLIKFHHFLADAKVLFLLFCSNNAGAIRGGAAGNVQLHQELAPRGG